MPAVAIRCHRKQNALAKVKIERTAQVRYALPQVFLAFSYINNDDTRAICHVAYRHTAGLLAVVRRCWCIIALTYGGNGHQGTHAQAVIELAQPLAGVAKKRWFHVAK
jgi:hypothetical protein